MIKTCLKITLILTFFNIYIYKIDQICNIEKEEILFNSEEILFKCQEEIFKVEEEMQDFKDTFRNKVYYLLD
jgi:hypothetical protein